MRLLFFLFLALSYSTVNSQNTRLNFSNTPMSQSDFDGEQIDCSDPVHRMNEDIIEPYIVYHANGLIAEEGLIVNNKPDGVWKKYDENGKLIGRIKYKNGSKSGKWVVRDNQGNLLAKGRYDNEGLKTGNWIYWSSVDQEYRKGSF